VENLFNAVMSDDPRIVQSFLPLADHDFSRIRSAITNLIMRDPGKFSTDMSYFERINCIVVAIEAKIEEAKQLAKSRQKPGLFVDEPPPPPSSGLPKLSVG
jgi:hypothetical protein